MVAAVLLFETVIAGPAGITQNARALPSADLTIGFLQSIDYLNPYRGLNDPSFFLYGLIYDYPYAFDGKGSWIPNIITAATHDASGFNWTYTVRTGVYWSDGSLLTPNDVAFTWFYDSQNLRYLWNYEPYFNQVVQCTGGKPAVGCGAYVTGANQVTVYFKRPFAAGEDLFGPIVQQGQWSVISPQCAGGYPTCKTPYNNSNPIGTGPFVADPNIWTEFQQVQAGTPGAYLHLTKNQRYHAVGANVSGSSNINVANLYIKFFNDATSLAQALIAGSIQLAQFTPSTIGQVQNRPGILVQSGLQVIQEWNEIGISQMDTKSVDANLTSARFDVNVRRAMALATDKQHIINSYYDGQGALGNTLISPVTPQWWYNPVPDTLAFDVQAANALLNRSGYTTWTGGSFGNGYRQATNAISLSIQSETGCSGQAGGSCWNIENVPNSTMTVAKGTTLKFTIATRPTGDFPEEYQTAVYLQEQYAQIGVQLVLKPEPSEDVLSSDVYNGQVEMYIWYWSSDPDPNYMLSMQSSWTLDGWSDNYWVNTTYNQMYLQQLADFNFNSRQQAVFAAQSINYEQAPYIIYIYPYGEWAMRTDVVPNGQQWSGWGNWDTDPYMQMNAFWGANPLFFNLTCPTCQPVVQNLPPTSPIIHSGSPVGWQVNEVNSLTATSSDPEATDTLNFTWTWGDGTQTYCPANQVVTNCTTSGGTSTASHAFNRTTDVVGSPYEVTVAVSDGYTGVSTQNPIFVNVTLLLIKGWISGTVTNKDTGKPILGAAVVTNSEGRGTTTNAQGHYNITVPPGTWNVNASASLFRNSTTQQATVTVNHTTALDFQLAPYVGWLMLTVKSSTSGDAIVGAAIYVTVKGASVALTSNQTDTNGQRNLTLEPGMYTVNVSATGYYSAATQTVQINASQTTPLNLQLAPLPQEVQGLSPVIIGAIVAVVVIAAVAVAAVFMTRRRKKKEEQEAKVELPPKPQ